MTTKMLLTATYAASASVIESSAMGVPDTKPFVVVTAAEAYTLLAVGVTAVLLRLVFAAAKLVVKTVPKLLDAAFAWAVAMDALAVAGNCEAKVTLAARRELEILDMTDELGTQRPDKSVCWMKTPKLIA